MTDRHADWRTALDAFDTSAQIHGWAADMGTEKQALQARRDYERDKAIVCAAVLAVVAERDALLDQHHRDSKELRRLCAQRDAARKVSKEAGAVIAGLKAERDALREALVMAEAMLCKQENELRSFGAHEPCAESAILTARAALAQEQGENNGATK